MGKSEHIFLCLSVGRSGGCFVSDRVKFKVVFDLGMGSVGSSYGFEPISET